MKTKFLFLLLFVVFIGMDSCKNDNDPDGDPDYCLTHWATSLQDELNAATNAAMVYVNNPTVANCNAYKAAVQAYLNALEPYGDCSSLTGQARADWEAAIDEAQEDINEYTCE
jgi:hypothetical protein